MPNTTGEFDVEAGERLHPAQRAELARARADELRQRRVELAGNVQISSDVAAFARRRAAQAVERAAAAWRAVLHRHVEAQSSHLRAAAAHEQAAMTVGDQACDLHQSAAARHRAAAEFHQDTVADLMATSPVVASAGVLHQD